MKNSILFFCALLISVINIAQNGINYKALIKDANGDVVANQAVTIQFSIAVPSAGAAAYAESHTTTTDANGIAIVAIGEGTPVFGDFTTIDWGSAEYFLNVQVDTGAGLVDLGTTAFKSVPYAKVAEVAKTIAPQPHKITSLKYPDGLENMTPVQFSGTSIYTVPAGKNLYLTHVADRQFLAVDFLTTNTVRVFFGVPDGGGNAALNQPLIAGSGEMVKGQTSEFEANGFLVDAIVIPVKFNGATYTVPVDKILIITNSVSGVRVNGRFSVNGPINIEINKYDDFFEINEVIGSTNAFRPIPVGAGQTVDGFNWTGYLIDE